MSAKHSFDEKMKEFARELGQFANTAEEVLEKIEENKDANKPLFSVFSEKMFAIRGTAQQLELNHIAEIAGLGEEIALKGMAAANNSQVRKCIGSLWDALTTVKWLIENHDNETTEEQKILVNRLHYTLESFGGARPSFSDQEILELLNKKSP